MLGDTVGIKKEESAMAAKEREYLNRPFACFCLINSQFGSSVCPSVCSVLCVVPITEAIKECNANCEVKMSKSSCKASHMYVDKLHEGISNI